jgi:hypothetical protein
MNDLPGRGDVNPYGIPVPNPHEREGPDEEERICAVCGLNQRRTAICRKPDCPRETQYWNALGDTEHG